MLFHLFFAAFTLFLGVLGRFSVLGQEIDQRDFIDVGYACVVGSGVLSDEASELFGTEAPRP